MNTILSIITVNYNNAAGLLATIQSVVAQQQAEVEFLVIDGGSTDESLQHIKANAKYISSYCSEPDNGVYDAMNKGIALAKGHYILFLNSGDTFYNASVLKTVWSALQTKTASILYGKPNLVFNGGREEVLESQPETMNLSFLINSTLNHQSAFILKTCLIEYGCYHLQYKYAADYEFFLKVYLKQANAFESLPHVIANYKLDGMSSKPENQLAIEHERQRIQLQFFTAEVIASFHQQFQLAQHPFYWTLSSSIRKRPVYYVLNALTQLRRLVYRLMKRLQR